MFKNIIFVFFKTSILCSFLVLSNCAPIQNNKIVDKTIEAQDPWESLNRSTFAFNLAFDKYILAPLAKGYRIVLPDQVRTGIRNFLNNLTEPWTSINSVLQGDVSNAGKSVARFFVNSTVGLLGFIDVASKLGVERQKEDFGQTLAVHGTGSGPYLVIPFLGPSTVRDAMGKVIGFIGDPVTLALQRNDNDEWVWIGTALNGIDFREQNLEKIDNLNATSVDFYATLRSLYLERRNSMIRNENIEEDPFQDYDLD
ncbi:MAG: hypothetical protein CMP24_07295 [Rickettsiales bacterium]|nr:hypothetical protein [Rickettsiales bacterium]